MELSFIGGCAPLFFLGLGFDLLGFVLLFVGIFADLRVGGRFYGDFLIYTGAIVVFCSLAWWLMWYVGNIRVSREGAGRGSASAAHRCKQLARKLTERLSKRPRKEDDQQSVMKTMGEEEGGGGGGASVARSGSKVTWGKTSCFHNEAFEEEEEEEEREEKKKKQQEKEKNIEMLL